jgi:peptidoglycan hydrolase-like protein with peptidoglycan-binding domain
VKVTATILKESGSVERLKIGGLPVVSVYERIVALLRSRLTERELGILAKPVRDSSGRITGWQARSGKPLTPLNALPTSEFAERAKQFTATINKINGLIRELKAGNDEEQIAAEVLAAALVMPSRAQTMYTDGDGPVLVNWGSRDARRQVPAAAGAQAAAAAARAGDGSAVESEIAHSIWPSPTEEERYRPGSGALWRDRSIALGIAGLAAAAVAAVALYTSIQPLPDQDSLLAAEGAGAAPPADPTQDDMTLAAAQPEPALPEPSVLDLTLVDPAISGPKISDEALREAPVSNPAPVDREIPERADPGSAIEITLLEPEPEPTHMFFEVRRIAPLAELAPADAGAAALSVELSEPLSRVARGDLAPQVAAPAGGNDGPNLAALNFGQFREVPAPEQPRLRVKTAEPRYGLLALLDTGDGGPTGTSLLSIDTHSTEVLSMTLVPERTQVRDGSTRGPSEPMPATWLNGLDAREPEPVRQSNVAREELALGLGREDRLVLQSRLQYLGFDPQGIDGYFGSQTRTAIADFQRSYGHAATGYLDAEQMRELERLSTHIDTMEVLRATGIASYPGEIDSAEDQASKLARPTASTDPLAAVATERGAGVGANDGASGAGQFNALVPPLYDANGPVPGPNRSGGEAAVADGGLAGSGGSSGSTGGGGTGGGDTGGGGTGGGVNGGGAGGNGNGGGGNGNGNGGNAGGNGNGGNAGGNGNGGNGNGGNGNGGGNGGDA